MDKKLKSLLSLMLAIVLIISSVPANVYAEETTDTAAIEQTEENSENTELTEGEETGTESVPTTLSEPVEEDTPAVIAEPTAADVAEVNGSYYQSLAEAVKAANAIEGGAAVTLLNDVELGEKLTISGNVTITGGKTITRASGYTGTLFAVNTGAALTFDGGLTIDGGNNWGFNKDAYDADLKNRVAVSSADSTKYFTPEDGAPVATAHMITTNGTINLNNVTIKNHYAASERVIVSAGTGANVNLNEAKITHCAITSGSGLVVNASTGKWENEAPSAINVTMNEGTVIDGNHVGGNHGVFKIYMDTTFTMNGGTIQNTTGWNSNGVVVGVYWANFIMNGGTICSNSSVDGPNNGRNSAIYVHNSSTFTMNDGIICHNTGAYGGIDSPKSNSVTTINGGSIVNNVSNINSQYTDIYGGTTTVINGGSYTQDVSQWLSPSADLVDNGDGTYTVVEDSTAPIIASVEQVYENEKEERIKVTLTFSEAVDKIAGGDWKATDSTKTKYTLYVYRTKDITVKFADAAGNEVSDVINVDFTEPEVTSVEQVYEEKEDGRIKVTLNFSRPVKDVVSGSTTWRSADEDTYFTYVYRTKDLEVSFKDAVAGIPGSYVVSVDKTAPTATFTYSNKNGSQVTKEDVTVTLTASEAIKDIEGWTKVDDVTFTKVFSENGKHSLDIYDLVGNKATVKFEVKRIDKVAPVINGVTDGAYYNEDVTYSVDEQSLSYVVIDGVEYKDIKKIPYTITSEGTHTIKAVDKAGNESVTVTFTIDKKLPNINVKGTANDNYYRDIESIALHDAVALKQVTINGNVVALDTQYVYIPADKIAEYGVVEGENVIVLEDKAGNSREFTFVYDTTAPTAEFTYSNNVALDEQTVTVTMTTSEALAATPEGWTKVSDTEYTKVFDANGKQTVDLKDVVGNANTVEFEIKEYQTVIVKAVVNGDKATAEDIYTGSAVKGTDLASFLDANVTIPAKTGYDVVEKWLNWDWFGNAYGANKVVEGWTNAYVNYVPNAYTIAYHGNGGVLENGKDKTTSTATYDAEMKVKNNPFTKEDWTFLGWATEADGEVVYKEGDKVLNLTSVNGGTVDLYAVWTPNTSVVAPAAAAYKVEHYKEQLDGTYKLEETEFPLYGELGEEVTAIAKEYDYYVLNEKYSEATGIVVMPTMSANGEPEILTLKMYYSLETHTVEFAVGEHGVLNGTESGTYKHGSAYPELPKVTAKEGYKFLGWFDAEGKEVKELPETVTEDAVYTAKYEKVSTAVNTGDAAPVAPMMGLSVLSLIVVVAILMSKKRNAI